MAGKRHHIIPQFLQKGFASHSEGIKVFAWVYRNDKEPYESNIRHIGVENNFYADNEDSLADDKITEAENQFYSNQIFHLRDHSVEGISNVQIADLLSHLEIRTRHFRQNFLSATNNLVEHIASIILNDPSYFYDFMKRAVRKDSSILKPVLVKQNYPEYEIKAILEFPDQLLYKFKHNKHLLSLMAPGFKQIISTKVKSAVKHGHNSALKKSISPNVKINRLKELNYQVLELSNPQLILGDAPVIFELNDQKRYKTFLEKKDELVAVYLPLSPSKLLVGLVDSTISGSNTSHLPEIIARCSWDFFISNEYTERNREYQELIRKDAWLISEEQLKRIADGIFE